MMMHERIKKRRLCLWLSQSQLAERMGYKDKSSISKIERGRVDLTQTQVIELARALETTTAYLLGVDES